MMMTSLSTVVSAISLHYSNNQHLRPPPRWISLIVFNCLGKILRMYPLKFRSKRLIRKERRKNNESGKSVNLIRYGYTNKSYNGEINSNFEKSNRDSIDNQVWQENNTNSSEHEEDENSPRKFKSEVTEILEHLRTFMEVIDEKEEEEDIRRQWRGLISIIDKFCFLVSIVLMIVCPIVIFFAGTKSG